MGCWWVGQEVHVTVHWEEKERVLRALVKRGRITWNMEFALPEAWLWEVELGSCASSCGHMGNSHRQRGNQSLGA